MIRVVENIALVGRARDAVDVQLTACGFIRVALAKTLPTNKEVPGQGKCSSGPRRIQARVRPLQVTNRSVRILAHGERDVAELGNVGASKKLAFASSALGANERARQR